MMTTLNHIKWSMLALLGATLLMPGLALASGAGGDGASQAIDLTGSWVGIVSLLVFVVAYSMVIAEEALHMRKSKPVMLAAGIIWILVGIGYVMNDDKVTAVTAIRHNLLEYAELLLFLLVAMTYINTMQERNVFMRLRSWLISAGYSLRTIFWLTGLLAFVISPIADNLTTALIMAAVVIAVGGTNTAFVTVACINIVVAANAGGAFSPFGDITTLMVWQKGIVSFTEFFDLFIPSIVNWLVPAVIMSLVVPKSKPEGIHVEVVIKQGGFIVIGLFVTTIVLAVCMHNFLHMPPVVGMMTGLGLLQFYSYFLKRNIVSMPMGAIDNQDSISHGEEQTHFKHDPSSTEEEEEPPYDMNKQPFDVYKSMERAEWDTLMFFYGVVLCVGGLGTIGYLGMLSGAMYVDLGPTWANILVGVLSAIVDNIPVMFAVLTMQPDMSLGQWLLVTLTAGVGGSLLSIGSAAGVALMGQARGIYTFFAHLKWTWAIALGYVASIVTHLMLNADLM